MITAIKKNLEKSSLLLKSIDQNLYIDKSIPPYFSSLGSHTRHILDFFQCIFTGYREGVIDLTKRERNLVQEENLFAGIAYLNDVLDMLGALTNEDLQTKVIIKDNLGEGIEKVSCTLAAVLFQANSHVTHHYAIIGFIIYQLGIDLPDTDFGYNPTTPKKEMLN